MTVYYIQMCIKCRTYEEDAPLIPHSLMMAMSGRDSYLCDSCKKPPQLQLEEKAGISTYDDALIKPWEVETCTLEEDLNKNHQNVIITTTDDAYKLLHNFWVDAGKDVAILATYVLGVSDNVAKPVIDAQKLIYGFDDFQVFAEKVEMNGKTFISFSGRNNRNQKIMHALVNGVRIKMNGKKYLIDSPKMQQLGFAPKTRFQGYKGAGAATFIISASIATTDLILNDDYHLVDWFGNVGTDMFKALVQVGATEVALLFVGGMVSSVIWAGAVAFIFGYIATEWFFNEFAVSEKVIKGLENVIEH